MWTPKEDEFLKAAQELGFLNPQRAAECRSAFDTISSTGVKIPFAKLVFDKGLLSKEKLKAVADVLRKRGVHPNIGPYDVLTRLGAGGSGTVYKAVDARDRRLVALKVLAPALAADPGQLRRFTRGAELAMKIAHANVCKTYEAGRDGADHFLAMEFVQGTSLLQMAAGATRMEEQRALEIIRQAAEGLSACHALGIVHRDVKPHNIIVTPAGVAKIVDLGLARETSSSRLDVTMDGNVVGTPQYMSPEQCADAKDVDARADIYSLGATLYYALTGMPPFIGDNLYEVMKQQSASQLPDPRALNPLVSRWAHALIWRMMTKERKLRPQSMQEVVDAISALQRTALTNTPRVIPLLSAAQRPAQPSTQMAGSPATQTAGEPATESAAPAARGLARFIGTAWGKAVAVVILAAALGGIGILLIRAARPTAPEFAEKAVPQDWSLERLAPVEGVAEVLPPVLNRQGTFGAFLARNADKPVAPAPNVLFLLDARTGQSRRLATLKEGESFAYDQLGVDKSGNCYAKIELPGVVSGEGKRANRYCLAKISPDGKAESFWDPALHAIGDPALFNSDLVASDGSVIFHIEDGENWKRSPDGTVSALPRPAQAKSAPRALALTDDGDLYAEDQGEVDRIRGNAAERVMSVPPNAAGSIPQFSANGDWMICPVQVPLASGQGWGFMLYRQGQLVATFDPGSDTRFIADKAVDNEGDVFFQNGTKDNVWRRDARSGKVAMIFCGSEFSGGARDRSIEARFQMQGTDGDGALYLSLNDKGRFSLFRLKPTRSRSAPAPIRP